MGVHQIAIKQLSKLDKNIDQAIKKYGMPNDRVTDGGFGTLLRMIVGQQISVKAAESVWKKITDIQANNPQNILSMSEKKLREVGLSRQKISYGKDLAYKVCSGLLDLDNLSHLSNQEAHNQLTQVKGIGDWTADIYQLFVLRDMDAFPQADIAVQEGAKRFFKLSERPSQSNLLKLVEKWKPLRGAGALVMWQIYRMEVHEGSKLN